MTEQECFDEVCAKMVAQGRRAMSAAGCALRAPNGDKCAVGCMIPDDEYDPELEGVGVHLIPIGERERKMANLINKLGLPLSLMSRLQRAHDYSYATFRPFAEQFIAKANAVADEMGLKQYSLE